MFGRVNVRKVAKLSERVSRMDRFQPLGYLKFGWLKFGEAQTICQIHQISRCQTFPLYDVYGHFLTFVLQFWVDSTHPLDFLQDIVLSKSCGLGIN